MVVADSLVGKLCALLAVENPLLETKEWRLLGQEQNGNFLFTWVETLPELPPVSHIGIYNFTTNNLKRIYKFTEQTNTIQASISSDEKLLGLVTKTPTKNEQNEDTFIYKPYFVKLDDKDSSKIVDLGIEKSKQIMVQFLYRKQSLLSEKLPEKVLVLIHDECVLQYQLKIDSESVFSNENFTSEILVKVFIWAQWDAIHQTLFYIHYRKPIKCLIEGEEQENSSIKVTPTLSGLQFHDDLPHETVLNIPLSLPHLSPHSASSCNIYEDDTVPLRIHNCSLDLNVLTDSDGLICICHHYLYQPEQPPKQLEDNADNPVNFAYSVTLLHQSCVIQCVIPNIPWHKAKMIRPFFKLYDQHILVFIPGICLQLLDIGVTHEPSCHVTTTLEIPNLEINEICLTSVLGCGKYCILNLSNLTIFDLKVTPIQLMQTFKGDTSIENKLAILHYLIVHENDMDSAIELINFQTEKPVTIGFPQILKEFLIGSAYATVNRSLPSDANHLINLLPITTLPPGCELEVTVGDKNITITQDALWNASMMLLSPQQRIVPYRLDIWVKLWDQLVLNAKGKQLFKPGQVVEKLLVSLGCYQPEALSRSSTPMSPAGSLSISNVAISKDIPSMKGYMESLPFYEIESCTASKQEHIISVNLRELSMHLLKQSTENKISRFQWQTQSPMHVHAVATRYIAAQLEQSRILCQMLCKAATHESRFEEKGFMYINQLPEEKQYMLFVVLERYYLAAESIAFPLPQGFTSFFTFLGYRKLRFNTFLQYVQRNVFELQVDVMKIIMADIDDDNVGIKRKLKLLTLLPKSRAKRLLHQWNHPVSLMLRAREHSRNILCGVEGPQSRQHGLQKSKNQLGIAAFPSANGLSPLDTFLDLLTAKASLNELDFGLLIEATVTSTEDFL